MDAAGIRVLLEAFVFCCCGRCCLLPQSDDWRPLCVYYIYEVSWLNSVLSYIFSMLLILLCVVLLAILALCI